MIRARAALAIGLVAGLAACERDPLDVTCPELGAGDLVVSEIAEGWLELYNASDSAIELAGTVVELQNIMGGDPDRIVVRDRNVTIGAQAYVVLGQIGAGFVDYAYAVDFDKDLYENARIRVIACDVVADEVVYWGLPGRGTITYDGGLEPDAAANDNADVNDSESDWCVDDTDEDGTPGEPNRACP